MQGLTRENQLFILLKVYLSIFREKLLTQLLMKLILNIINKLLKEDSKTCFGKGYSKPEKAVNFITRAKTNMELEGEDWILLD